MTKKLKILLASSEVAPFAKTGGLADVAGSLPSALQEMDCEVSVFLPFYRHTKTQDLNIKLVKRGLKAELGHWDFDFSLFHTKREGVDFYFIDKEEYYDRDFLYGTPQGDYPDNAKRFAFFANAVLTGAQAINFKPDIIHCNDWQSALIPFYIKYKFQNSDFLKHAKTLFTVHNLAYQGLFEKDIMPELGIGYEFFTPDTLEFWDKFSFMKAGILYSNAISTVSAGYAREILTKEFGCGLDGLLNVRKNDLYGVLNGVDYSEWNPKVDRYIKAKYDETSLEGKEICKKDLLSEMKLSPGADKPLLGVISRLAAQKGIDIIADCAEAITKLGASLVILGTGDEKYHKILTALAKKYPKTIAVKIAFDNSLAHKIEAGSDMFLMPSRYEPCGLNQMYSLKYATIPLVRATGGLDDTIIDYTKDPKNANGFKFNEAEISDFMDALKRAVSVYKNKKQWHSLMLKAMSEDFSWGHSAKEYIKLYKKIQGARCEKYCASY